MQLRFEVNQAEAFRRGVDCPKSIVTVDADPSTLTQADRDLIADRLAGIDVRRLDVFSDGRRYKTMTHIMANLPTFEALMEAIRKDVVEVAAEAATAGKVIVTPGAASTKS